MLAKERLGSQGLVDTVNSPSPSWPLDHQNNLENIPPSRRTFLVAPSSAVQLLSCGSQFFPKSGMYRSLSVGIFLQECNTALSDRISICRQCINVLIFSGREGSGGLV